MGLQPHGRILEIKIKNKTLQMEIAEVVIDYNNYNCFSKVHYLQFTNHTILNQITAIDRAITSYRLQSSL